VRILQDALFIISDPRENPKLLQQTIDCYQKVFGEAPWNEGYYCSREGKSRHFSLKMAENHNYQCDLCGADLLKYHTEKEIEKRIYEQLSGNSIFIAYFVNTALKGFAWSCVMGLADIPESIMNVSPDLGEQREIDKLKNLLYSRGLESVNYGYELGILPDGRNGFKPVATLTRMWLEHGIKQGVPAAIFSTVEKSNIYKLAVMGGFKPIFKSQGGLEFLLTPDCTELVQILSPAADINMVTKLLHRPQLVGI